MSELMFSMSETEWFAEKQRATKALVEQAQQNALAQGQQNERLTLLKIFEINKIPPPPQADFITKDGIVIGVKWEDGDPPPDADKTNS